MAFRMMMRFFETKKDENINYYEYIQSEEWKEKAEAAKRAAGYRCQLCNVSGYSATLNAHHNTYERLGKELINDIAVLCDTCHKAFHQNGSKPGRKVKLSRDDFLGILRREGITFTNDDPWRYYERGKVIIQHMINGLDAELYDYYNKINVEVLEGAILNTNRQSYKEAKMSEDWKGYETEYNWREANDYWEGYSNNDRNYRIPKGV